VFSYTTSIYYGISTNIEVMQLQEIVEVYNILDIPHFFLFTIYEKAMSEKKQLGIKWIMTPPATRGLCKSYISKGR